MAIIKSYTDINQSKKLAEILPLESADMYYSHEFVNSAGDYYRLNIASDGYFDDEESPGSDIPAWSLAALLGVLPDYTLQTNTDRTVFVVCESKKPMISDACDNPVDACYEIILKLHELKML